MPKSKIAANAERQPQSVATKRPEPAPRSFSVAELLSRLHARYPDAHCSLNFNTPFELLVATILSAQCTDERVNKVTEQLFRKYRSVADFADAAPSELEADLNSINFYRNKAKNIQAAARRLLDVYQGRVPETMEQLLTLPGVARKTANVVLGNAFGKPVGVVVDTHVKRVAYRLGLTKHETPEKIEPDLMDQIPQKSWVDISHLLIYHGRQYCKAPRPLCADCPLADICPSKDLQ